MKPQSYGDIIFAARQALDADLPERDIVTLLRRVTGVTPKNPYKRPHEKLTADLPEYHRRRRAERKALGLCTDCGRKNDRTGAVCVACHARRGGVA